VALVGSFTLLKLSGGTLNAFTLFGLVLATGVVVDDAIVVSEDIGRRISGGAKPFRAAREAMDELSGAVIATSLVLIVVFLPVLVMPGSLGRLYQPLAVVISSTILFSTINALSFTPVASAVLLGKSFRPAPKQVERLRRGLARSSQWLDALQQPYQRLLERALRRRRLVLSLLGAGLLITAIGLQALPTGFVPQEDGGQIRGVVVLPEGASLERTQSAMQRVQQAVASEPLVRYGNFYAGRSFGDSAPNKGIFFLRLKPLQQRSTSTSEVVERLNPALQRAMAGDGRVILSQPQPVRGFGSEGGISLNLLDVSGGRLSLQQFGDEADDFIAAAKASGRFERVGTRFSANAPSLEVIPDRQQLAAVGVSLEEVVAVIGDSFGSTYVNDTFSDARVRRVIVQLQGSDRSSPGDVLRLLVRNRDGRLIPLSNLVRLEPTTGPTSINHSELSRAISIRAKPKRGISSGQAMATLERVQQQRNTPTTELQFTGLSLEEQRAGGGTWKLFGLGLLVVYLLLAALYESAIDPVIILITVPLALLGVVLGLAARGLFLDVYGQVGILVLISLAAKNGILIVEFANQRVKRGIAIPAAIREAASLRLRPILLTGVSSLAGFLPLVLASGAGAARSISIGTVAFSGLLASTALSLLVLPVVYEIVKTWEMKRTQKLG
jgi:hydrophobe/amphiphile efflux-1 (HAE1) family protein